MPDFTPEEGEFINPVWYINPAIENGESATSALNAFREAGGAIRTQDWYRVFGEVNASVAGRAAAAALDPFSLPAGSDYVPWTLATGGQYATSVNVLYRDRESGAIGFQQYLYKTDQPHTPAEAQLAAIQDFGDPDNERKYNRTTLGAFTKNVYATIPYQQ